MTILSSNLHTCITCETRFYRGGCKKLTAKYCSIKCKAIGQKGKHTKGAPKTGKNVLCLCGKIFYTARCYLSKGRKYCSKRCYYKYGLGKNTNGKKHWNWKGGIKPINQKLRTSKRASSWRTKVFRRDNYTCQKCKKQGGKIVAHHKKSWSKYPKLRFVVSNGITYCEDCHKETPNYKRNADRD